MTSAYRRRPVGLRADDCAHACADPLGYAARHLCLDSAGKPPTQKDAQGEYECQAVQGKKLTG